jgi:hypothetical protein
VFGIVDWENNAVTGAWAAPATAVRDFCETIDAELGPDRVAWYSYRYLANAHRSMLHWPLWLSDPNPDAEAWAEYLGAVIVQTGQTEPGQLGHPFTLLTDSIYNREIFARLTGEQTVPTPQEFLDTEVGKLLGDDLTTEVNHPSGRGWTVRETLVYAHRHAKLAEARALRSNEIAVVGSEHAARAADNSATAATIAARVEVALAAATIGLTPEQLTEALRIALRAVAPTIRVSVTS